MVKIFKILLSSIIKHVFNILLDEEVGGDTIEERGKVL